MHFQYISSLSKQKIQDLLYSIRSDFHLWPSIFVTA